MKYRIVIAIILIISLLIAAALVYVNNVFLPVQVKAKIVQELEKTLAKNVRIEKLRYNLIKGLVVQNLVIYDRSLDQTYLSAEEISLNLLIFPLFQKKIIIPLLRIDSPKIYLKIKPDNTLNLMELFKIQTAQKEKPKFSFLISKIDLSNGSLQFKDERSSPASTKEISNIKIGAGFNLPGSIKFILQAKILNPPGNPSFLSASGQYYLSKQSLEAKVKLEKLQILDSTLDAKGNILLLNNRLDWQDFVFTYKQMQYNSSGSLVDFKQPKIDFNLGAKDFTANTSLTVQDKVIKITSCAGKYLDSEFSLKGNIDTKDQTSPLINLDLDLNVILKDTFGLLPANLQDNLKNLKLDGQCKIVGNIFGGIKEFKDLNADLKLTSDNLSISGFKLDNLYFTLEQKKRWLNIRNFMANLYSGNANLQSQVNLEPQIPTYTAKIILSNIDLAKLKMDTKLKDKDISGLFSLNMDLIGETAKLETLQGQGALSVKEGKLWELNLFKGLGEFLFMPIYQKIVFKDMDINFTVKDKAINIVDSFLGSEKLDLSCAGRLGFDGALDLTLNSQINEELIKDVPDLRKFTSAVLGNLLVIKIGGTIQQPEFKVVPGTKEIINRLKDLFFGR